MSPATKSRRPPPLREDRRPDGLYATSDIGRNERVGVLLIAIKGTDGVREDAEALNGAFGGVDVDQ